MHCVCSLCITKILAIIYLFPCISTVPAYSPFICPFTQLHIAKTLAEFGYTILSKFQQPHEISIAKPRVIHFVRRNRDLDTELISEAVSHTSESSKLFLQIKEVHRKTVETFTNYAKQQVEQSENYTDQLDAYRKNFDVLFEAEKRKKRKGE
jgi:hypothetical protein